MNRRGFLLLGAAGALAACARGGGAGAPVLNVGSQRGGTKAVMLASGVLAGAPYRVDWSEFAAAQPLLEAIGGGAVDLGVVGDAPFMFAYQSGSPIKAVGAQFVRERPTGTLALIVPQGSSVRTLADLKGKRVATTRGSVGHYLVIRALRAAKLPPDWVRYVFLAPGDAKAAFSSGAIDGWATWAPYLFPAFREGARTIVDGRDFVKAYGFEVANEQSIATKRAQIADFLKREARALAWARTHADAYAMVLSRETGLPIEIARDYALKNGRTAIPIDGSVIADQRRVLDDFHAAGAVTASRDVAQGFDTGLSATRVASAN